ncbi:hypothetical protein ACV3S0_07820 [Clostridium perfringens]
MNNLGIVVIGYNRVNSLDRILNRLNFCEYFGDKITLIISIDNCGKRDAEEYAKSFKWNHGEKIVKTFPKRLGLRKHVLKCGNYMNEFNLDAIAVFEDDIYPSICFYNYMKQSVDFYKNNKNIAGISLYNHNWNVIANKPFYPMNSVDKDNYFMQFAQSWGQIWMRKSWNDFYKWYKENENYSDNLEIPLEVVNWPKTSWLKYHIKYCIEQNKYFVYPYKSLSTCFTDCGEHAVENSSKFQVVLEENFKKIYKFELLDRNAIKYDAFFENQNHDKILTNKHINNNIDFDLYGQKRKINNKRYLLSCKKMPYKCIKSFDMALRPWELNIQNNIKGDKIFLYDTHLKKNEFKIKSSILNLSEWIYFQKDIPSWNILFSIIKYKINYKSELIKIKILKRK